MPTDLDVYAPERWRDDALFRPEVKKAYADLVKHGWTDSVRTLNPEKRIYTFWKYFRNAFARDAGLRIDHLLLSPDLAKRLRACGVDKFARAWDKSSDHAPVWIELAAAENDAKQQRQTLMPRKLKTFVTNLGFFEMAIAAPSMKAALEAWGMSHNAFQHGFAKQTDDPKIVAATMEKPGIVLKRPVGTTGAFSENAELPKELWKGELPKVTPAKKKPKPVSKPKPETKKARGDKKDQAAILSFEKAKAKRERERQWEEEREAASNEREQARIERAVAKADEALEAAQDRHDKIIADIEKEREKLERRAKIERERWDKERHKLEAARQRAKD